MVNLRSCCCRMIIVENNTYIVDVQGTFLHGEFDNCEVLCCKIPERFELLYDPRKYYCRLKNTAYGLKQAAIMF